MYIFVFTTTLNFITDIFSIFVCIFEQGVFRTERITNNRYNGGSLRKV